MPLTDAYIQVPNQLPKFFKTIAEGQAPDQFTLQHLKDLGFTSVNHRSLIPLLKALGFLSKDGAPTQRYHEYRDPSQSRRVMAQALREAYADLFTIKAKPAESDRQLIRGKFKSTHNVKDRLANLMTSTFYAILGLADLEAEVRPAHPERKKAEAVPPAPKEPVQPALPLPVQPPALHYSIQIHLPASKDIEVFNAIFKSLREHLLG
jgi:hypothetical protein